MKRSHRLYDALKRAGDMAVASLLLILLSPILLAAALVIRVTLGPPVLFRQTRPGLLGRPFTLYKFRTMRTSEATGVDAVASDASRLTPVGRFLRASSIDELPELFNVVRGDMSIVGPRPLLMEYLERYNERQARRHEVRPGITGWAQVNGRNALAWDERFELDVEYVDGRSFLFDARILLLTVATVLSRKGVSAQGQATMEPFDPGASAHKEDS